MIRTFAQQEVEDLAQYGSIPIINGLTDYAHPCQVLADLMTIREHKGSFKGLKLCFVGDGNNMIVMTVLLLLVLPKFQKMQVLTDNLNRVTMENLSGVRVVRAYNAEAYQNGKFETANEELTKNQLFTSRGMSSSAMIRIRRSFTIFPPK